MVELKDVVNYAMLNNVLFQLDYEGTDSKIVVFYDKDTQGLHATADTLEDAMALIKFTIERDEAGFRQFISIPADMAQQVEPVAMTIDLTAKEVKVLAELTSGIIDSGASRNTQSYIKSILGLTTDQFDEIAYGINAKLV